MEFGKYEGWKKVMHKKEQKLSTKESLWRHDHEGTFQIPCSKGSFAAGTLDLILRPLDRYL